MQLNINVRQVILMARESILKPSLLCNPEERENEMMELKKALSKILEIRPLLREIVVTYNNYDEAKEDGLVSTYEDIEFGEEYDRFKIDGEWCTTLSACPNKYEINRLKSQIAVYLQQVTRTLSKYYGKRLSPSFADILTAEGLDRKDEILKVIKPIVKGDTGKRIKTVLDILILRGYVERYNVSGSPQRCVDIFNSIGANVKYNNMSSKIYVFRGDDNDPILWDREDKWKREYPELWKI